MPKSGRRPRSGMVVVAGALAALLAAGCGGGGSSTELTPQDRARVAAAAEALVMTQQVIAVLDQIFKGGATLDTSLTIYENAQNLQFQAERAASCLTVGLDNTTVSVDFGAGCAVRGLTVTGSLTLAVSKSSADAVNVAVVLTDLTVSGLGPITGASSFGASLGAGGLAASLDLVTASSEVSGPLTITSPESSLTLDGTLTVKGGGVADGGLTDGGATEGLEATLNAVTFNAGSCYPFAGSADLPDDVNVAFVPTTPADGQVQVTKGATPASDAGDDGTSGTVTPLALPAYGACPPPA